MYLLPRIVPQGKQGGLKPVALRGAISVEPRKEDFFTRVVEYRTQNKSNERLQHFLKILANSTSSGTYLELNPKKTDPSNRRSSSEPIRGSPSTIARTRMAPSP